MNDVYDNTGFSALKYLEKNTSDILMEKKLSHISIHQTPIKYRLQKNPKLRGDQKTSG